MHCSESSRLRLGMWAVLMAAWRLHASAADCNSCRAVCGLVRAERPEVALGGIIQVRKLLSSSRDWRPVSADGLGRCFNTPGAFLLSDHSDLKETNDHQLPGSCRKGCEVFALAVALDQINGIVRNSHLIPIRSSGRFSGG